MNKLHSFYVVLIALQLIVPENVAFCIGQVREDTSISTGSRKIFTVQVAASKVFIDPDFFKQKFNITDTINYYVKDGWYKYVLGAFKTEREATEYLAGLNIEAFVTSITDNKVDIAPQLALQIDTIKPPAGEAELRRIYHQKIREADSVFNISKNLLLARKLYQEVALISPEKNYPKDQVIEIDKLLTQKKSRFLSSKLPLRFYIVSGFCIAVFTVIVLLLFLRRKNRIGRSMKPERIKIDRESAAIKLLDNTEKSTEVVTEAILQLYPGLAREISKKFGDIPVDYHSVHDETEECLNSKNEIVRIEAELALIQMDTDDPCSFLDKLNQEFTSWEQLHVYEMIKRNQMSPPDFSRWLTSPNQSVILFSERMILAFRQEREINIQALNSTSKAESNGIKGLENLFRTSGAGLQAAAGHILDQRIRQ